MYPVICLVQHLIVLTAQSVCQHFSQNGCLIISSEALVVTQRGQLLCSIISTWERSWGNVPAGHNKAWSVPHKCQKNNVHAARLKKSQGFEDQSLVTFDTWSEIIHENLMNHPEMHNFHTQSPINYNDEHMA